MIDSVATDLPGLVAAAERRYIDGNPESRRRHEERAEVMPGGNTRSVIHVPPFPLTIMRGEGARLVDADGHEYVDSSAIHRRPRHSHPVILQAIREALDGVRDCGMACHTASRARGLSASGSRRSS